MTTRLAAARDYLRRNGAAVAVEVVVNFLGPFAIYKLTKARLGDVGALIASSAPPIAWSLIEFLRKRRIDAVSVLVLAGIALSLVAFIGGGGAKFLQMREHLVTGLIGLVFLASVAVGRPLIYELARATMLRRDAAQAASFEALRDSPFFRATMRTMTLVWGFGLIAESAATSALVFTMSIGRFLIVAPVVGYGFAGALTAWTWWYARRAQRLGAARRAAAAAKAASVSQSSGAEG